MILFQLLMLIARHMGMIANYVFRTGQEFSLNSYGHYSTVVVTYPLQDRGKYSKILNPLNAELNPICHLLALLGIHHFLHVSRIRVKSLTLRLLMSYVYIYIYIYIYICGAPTLDVSRSHTTTQHSR